MVWGERRPRREVPEQFQALAPARRVAGAVPLRQGSQGSRFMGGQVFVLGQGGDRLQEQPEQRHREETGKGNHTRTRGMCWNLPESGTVAGLGALDCRQRGLKPSYSQQGA